ncbi:volume-regulated anion channel subunit LRRC8A-like isoform X1 [Xenia sp. Carnegie-2017]|uniref:volume-regulated anion channel subunit LRRC8A-like isoform X1 n=1 Tax=Xenia sp. Carnegie-2017 TaxID=2897299 RepID=UPI001F04D5D6|nr:volume-regulated anion channel subunit LRRC8A-like isoform X1 [Xenia sp. Carnegie-2017]
MMSMEYFWKGRKVKYKILKPFWDIITDYLVILLAMLSVAVAGMEITSGSFECVAVVDCPHVTKSNLNVTWPQAHLKFPDVCANFYRSQNSNFVARTEVVTDHKVNIIYKSFVNLECRKSAIPKYLSYLWLILFVEALWLLVLNDFWLKLPLTSSVIKTFVDLVMACYDSPSSNFAVTRALFQKNSNRKKSYVRLTMEDTSDLTDQTYNFDFLPDTTSTSEMMGLYEKVQKLKENISTSHPIINISNLYTIKSFLQPISAIIFLAINIYFLIKDLKADTMMCTLTQHIPIQHDYFLCSHGLAPTLFCIVCIYNIDLFLNFLIFLSTAVWNFRLRNKTYEYDFKNKIPRQIAKKLSDIYPEEGDLGFLLHYLHSYNKMFVIRFAHLLSKKYKKKFVAHALKMKFPVADLKTRLKEKKELSFTELGGIPPTIFDQSICDKILKLEFTECHLEHDDFKDFNKFTQLTSLSIVTCGLESIPRGVLDLKKLRELRLDGNCIKKITADIADLENLSILSLKKNHLKKIDPGSLSKIKSLHSLETYGNPDLEHQALRDEVGKLGLSCLFRGKYYRVRNKK